MPDPGRTRLVAFRCDGGERVGAGHVGRCLPLARALERRGWLPRFVGSFDGLAGVLVGRSGLPVSGAAALEEQAWAAAVVDSYSVPSPVICELARRIPVATIGEANRCHTAGVLIDFHLDRAGESPAPRLLPGPAFALVDPGFAAARRDRSGPVHTALVTVGGSEVGDALAVRAIEVLREVFPEARIVLAGGRALPVPLNDVERLPQDRPLLDAVLEVDVAVSAAGNTAYELAAAGIPAVLVPIVENQRRVADGAARAGMAVVASDDPGQAIRALTDARLRARLQVAATKTVDGHGADRAAAALEERWESDDR